MSNNARASVPTSPTAASGGPAPGPARASMPALTAVTNTTPAPAPAIVTSGSVMTPATGAPASLAIPPTPTPTSAAGLINSATPKSVSSATATPAAGGSGVATSTTPTGTAPVTASTPAPKTFGTAPASIGGTPNASAAYAAVANGAATPIASATPVVATSTAAPVPVATAAPAVTAAPAPAAVSEYTRMKAAGLFEPKSKLQLPERNDRQLLKQGGVLSEKTFKIAERWLFVFDDYIVYAKGDKKTGRFELSVGWDLTTIRIDDRVREKDLSKNPQMAIAFTLLADSADTPAMRDEIKPVFAVKTQKEKDEWTTAIARAIRSAHERKSPELKATQSHTGYWHGYHLGTLHSSIVFASTPADDDKVKEMLDAATAAGDVKAVNRADDDGLTPLHLAIRSANVPLVTLLLKAGADTTCRDNAHKSTPLHLAAIKGQDDIIELLLCKKPTEVDALDALQLTPLWIVCTSPDARPRRAECIKLLAAHHADVDVKAKDGNGDALLAVVASRNEADTVRALIAEGATLEPTTKTGRSVLHSAAAADAIDAVKVIIGAGAQPNLRDFGQNTPLHLCKKMETAAYLVSRGARTDLVNKAGTRASFLFENKDGAVLPPIAAATTQWEARGVAVYEDTKEKIAALSSGNGSKQWVEDSHSDVCQLCMVPFSWTRRKHHCRQCGVLCCYYCSSHQFQRRAIGTPSGSPAGEILRACDGCFNGFCAKKAAAAAAAAAAKPKPERPSQSTGPAPHTSFASAVVSTAPTPASPTAAALPVAAPVATAADPRTSLLGAKANEPAPRGADRHGTAASTAASLAQSKQALAERGEKLKRMEDKSANLAAAGANFADLAKKLKEKQENSWF